MAEETRLCPRCGSPNANEKQICGSCGNDLNSSPGDTPISTGSGRRYLTEQSIGFSDYLSCAFSSLYVLLNPGKYKAEVDKSGPGIQFIMESFRLALDARKILSGGIFVLSIALVSLLVFPIQIIQLMLLLSSLVSLVPGLQSQIGNFGRFIGDNSLGSLMIFLALVMTVAIVNYIAVFLQLIGASTSDALKGGKEMNLAFYRSQAYEKKGVILSPLYNILLVFAVFAVFVALTGYITYISYIGELFLAAAYPVVMVIGIVLGLALMFTIVALLLTPGATFQGEGDREEHPFVKACSVIVANFPQFIKGQALLIFTTVIFVVLIVGVLLKSIGLAVFLVNGILIPLLAGKMANVVNFQVHLWPITLISISVFYLVVASVLLSMPLVFFITANTVLYRYLSHPKDVPMNIIDVEDYLKKHQRRNTIITAVYLLLAGLGYLFSISFFDPYQAAYHYNNKEFGKALKLYSKVVQRDPRYHLGFLRIGICEYRLRGTGNDRDFPAILEPMERALGQIPKYAESEPLVKEIFNSCASKLDSDRKLFGEGRFLDSESVYELVCKYFPKDEAADKRLKFIKKVKEEIWPDPLSTGELEIFDGPVVDGKPRGKATEMSRFMVCLGVHFTCKNKLYDILSRKYDCVIQWYKPYQASPETYTEMVLIPYSEKKADYIHVFPVRYGFEPGTHRLEILWNGKKLAERTFNVENEMGPANSIVVFHHLLNNKEYDRAYNMLHFDWRQKQPFDKFKDGFDKTEYCYIDKVSEVSYKDKEQATATAVLVFKDSDKPKEKRITHGYELQKAWNSWMVKASWKK